MNRRSLTDLRKVIQANSWVKGAVNYDEDLHFSTYYLRASCADVTAALYPGYSCLVAFFEHFNETYYLLERECRATAAAIVDRALRQPRWLPGILEKIRRRSDALADIFPPELSPAALARLPTARLLAVYRRHDRCQRALYRYARLPEALDRGVSYFTGYLVDCLRQQGVPPAACAEVFDVLSQPVEPSVLSQEMLEFDRIVRDARSQSLPIGELTRAAGRARILLEPELIQRLDAHRAKWQFLSYHGYGRRELATLDQYIDRLVKQAANTSMAEEDADLLTRCRHARKTRAECLRRLKMDRAHRALFEAYPEIGAVKLYRRYAQLRNFYYLDMLLAEIAQRVGVREQTIRCMLPEEIVDSLRLRRLVNPAVHERLHGCLFAILHGQEFIVPGAKGMNLGPQLRAKTQTPPTGELQGVVACRGKAAGPCKVIIRADDHAGDFAKGTIVVSESTDPDLVRFLRLAGAVLTEQGGVTSHAAIICRELGVPTIIGIEGLLERVRDGDWLEVDAEGGTVTVLGRSENGTAEGSIPPPSSLSPQVVGAKAYNLAVVRALGFRVPEFVVVDYETARRWARRRGGRGGRNPVEQALRQLRLSNGDRLALRSSAVGEDQEDGSAAGQYHSLLHVERDHVPSALREFVTRNRVGRNGSAYRGSVIVQRMIQADCAGVCLTQNPRAGTGNAVVIEMAAGGNERITGGTTRPDRVVVDRLTGDILDDRRRSARAGSVPLDVSWLVNQFLTLEARFGKPLDIEWALAGKDLYILQARPIVAGQ